MTDAWQMSYRLLYTRLQTERKDKYVRVVAAAAAAAALFRLYDPQMSKVPEMV